MTKREAWCLSTASQITFLASPSSISHATLATPLLLLNSLALSIIFWAVFFMSVSTIVYMSVVPETLTFTKTCQFVKETNSSHHSIMEESVLSSRSLTHCVRPNEGLDYNIVSIARSFKLHFCKRSYFHMSSLDQRYCFQLFRCFNKSSISTWICVWKKYLNYKKH